VGDFEGEDFEVGGEEIDVVGGNGVAAFLLIAAGVPLYTGGRVAGWWCHG